MRSWSGASPPNGAVPPVLLVDNNVAKRLAVRATLAPLGCRIVEADSGRAALRCLIEEDFAVILLDVRMPTMDGFETASLIRLRQKSEMTPIIFVTGHAADELVSDRYAQGAVDFLCSPFEPVELRAKVSVFLNLFQRAEALAAKAKDVQASVDQLRLLTDAAPIGIFQTDARNRYIYSNPRWSEITGMSSAAAEGQGWDVIIAPGQHSSWAVGSRSTPLDSAEMSRQFTITSPDETPKIVLLKSLPLLGPDGVPFGWVGTLADITSEVGAAAAMSEARDRAKDASRMKSDFLANMSHEIRTPMNGVLGMTELLLDTELDPSQREYAQTVRVSGEALLTVINDILDFSKIEVGKLEVERIALDVRTTVSDVVNLLEGSAQSKGLALTATVAPSVPATITGDPGRLRQVVTNLIGNAIKFSDQGEIAVRVTTPGDAGADALIRFDVSDMGIGIAPSKLAMIFEPFAQEDTSATRRHSGTGLGLAISAQLVTLMGGEIGITSELGVGSTFWFTVSNRTNAAETPAPIGRDIQGVDEGRHCAVSAAPGTDERGRLLVVEDNLINLKVAVAMLMGAGYTVDTAGNGLDAVHATHARDYDVILMDCQMPDTNGYEATALIRAREGTSRRTPIVALTAGAREEDRERCLAEGMDDYLSKPFTKEALLGVVQGWLRKEVVAGA